MPISYTTNYSQDHSAHGRSTDQSCVARGPIIRSQVGTMADDHRQRRGSANQILRCRLTTGFDLTIVAGAGHTAASTSVRRRWSALMVAY